MSNGNKDIGWTAALFVVRWIIGLLFFMAGYWKVFDWTPAGHVGYFIESLGESWIPLWLLTVLGTVIPFWELLAGALLLVGYQVRTTLISLGVLLIMTTYGHALMEPLFDIDGHTFTRLALIVFLLVSPTDADRWSLDQWLIGRKGGGK